MAHYAFLDENSIVTEVIPGKDETELIDGVTPEEWYGNYRGQTCVRTSYNTQGGVNSREGGEALRKNYAGIGYTWDGTGFAAPQPYPSWSLDLFSYLWQAPVAMPEDGKKYSWDEATTSWVEVAL